MEQSKVHSSTTLPSLLLFGPQTTIPQDEELDSLVEELVLNPNLSHLRLAIHELPQFWREILRLEPDLNAVDGERHLSTLTKCIEHGGSDRPSAAELPNICLFPLTFALQIVQYTRYLRSLLVPNAHEQVFAKVKHDGISGFCVGFLGALTVSSSKTERDIAVRAASFLRLAVCIGAYVDRDSTTNDAVCISVLSRDPSGLVGVGEILKRYPNANENSVSVTTLSSCLRDLTEEIRTNGFRVKDLPVRGRFHTSAYSLVADKLVGLFVERDEWKLPEITDLTIPVHSPASDKIVVEGNLARHVLENTLLKPVAWFNTLDKAIQDLTSGEKHIAAVGFGNCISPSILQIPQVRVTYLEKVKVARFAQLLSPTPGTTPSMSRVMTPTPSETSEHQEKPLESNDFPPHAIAIVGVAGRFPGADSIDELWDIITAGKSMVRDAPVDRIGFNFLPQSKRWMGNFLENPESFDHKFFNKSSREAQVWDPQQRILLEVVYESLESAGYFGAKSTVEPKDYGCYIGAVMNNYEDNVSCHKPSAYATIGTSRGFISGAMSHYFGWTGPALSIDTACSSSLVAINSACRAIWSGECSRAVAGGTNVITSPYDYQNLDAAGFLSPTGQCRPFDADGDGYCRGEGVGVVVLKPLSSAIEEHDHIFGVITGSAANQNYNDSHITVPHSQSQIELYRKVMSMSGVVPEEVTYVEAHGTGTGVGDPVEVRSIREAFGSPYRESALHFSSLKGNIGHTEATAGVAGLIKVLLMMRHGQIPPQASHKTLNPKIHAVEMDRMAIPKELIPWHPSRRIACVNSYGAAGSNSAVMIREMPGQVSMKLQRPATFQRLPLFLTAASPGSLEMQKQKLLAWIDRLVVEGKEEADLASILFNVNTRANHALQHKIAASVADIKDLKTKLSASTTFEAPRHRSAVLVFGGQESSSVGLSEEVYNSSSLFRHHLDDCQSVQLSLGYEAIIPAVFQQSPIANLVTLHSALFAVQYASAKAWLDCGLKVDAVLGHSFGQLTALCVSGVLSLRDALKLVAGRASLMLEHWGSEPGSMTFVQASRAKVAEILAELMDKTDYLEIACYNGPESHVVVGSSTAVEALEVHVAQQHPTIRVKKLKVTNGFHSKYTEKMLPHLEKLAEGLEWKIPTIPLETCDEFESNVEPDHRLIPHHTRRPVFFHQAVDRLATKHKVTTWLEAGVGSSITRLIRGCIASKEKGSLLPAKLGDSSALTSLVDTTINLWRSGSAVQYWLFHQSQRSSYRFLSVPPYQFERTKHWLPFRRNEVAKVVTNVQPDVPEKHNLLSLISGDKDGKATFRISPKSERFQALCAGHVMSDQSLAPASLYYEVAARAALVLEGDTEASTWLPSTERLSMHFPIVPNKDVEIVMTLNKLDEPTPAWSFAITTQTPMGTEGHLSRPMEHADGIVRLIKHDDADAARRFQRFERVTGYRRYRAIMDDPEAEKMQGKHVYRAFGHVVNYGEAFQGIKTVSCVDKEAAGIVRITPDKSDPTDQRLTDAPMTDSFMQFAGILVNYFNNPDFKDTLLVCHKIDHTEIGSGFSPDIKEWFVYSNMSDEGEGNSSSDVYVFDAETRKMVFAAFGLHFSKMSRASLARLLKGVNKSGGATSAPENKSTIGVTKEVPIVRASVKNSSQELDVVLDILSNITDLPVEELKNETSVSDLGIDSLAAIEIINEIRGALNFTIDLSSFMFFPNIKAILDHVQKALRIGVGATDEVVEVAAPRITEPSTSDNQVVETEQIHVPEQGPRPTIISANSAFAETRHNYDQLARGAGALDYYSEVYPGQTRLVEAYVRQAFAKLGCDVASLRPGEAVPMIINFLPRHEKLVRQLYRVLEDGKLIEPSHGGYIRTDVEVDTTSAQEIYDDTVPRNPDHSCVNHVVRAIGSELAECLTGEKNGLQILFGNQKNKKELERFYRDWPLSKVPIILLGDFLRKALTNFTGTGKFRILEIGAGTGGATRHIVDLLTNHGIPFEYHFTDISGALVDEARKKFKGVVDMTFGTLDVEKAPSAEFNEAFHVIIAANCIHATKNLKESLTNMRRMLREDGALTMIEITRNIYIFDIIVGLFDGWWSFEDDRNHALVDVKHWERVMKEASFGEVSWTEGASRESEVIRVIAAFPTAVAAPAPSRAISKPEDNFVRARIHEIPYKSLGTQNVMADVYCPVTPDPTRKLPIALMIHGGSHIIFSRKDVRPAQTQLLLNQGYLPVSIDYSLCPEAPLASGAMVDVLDALEWAQTQLPNLDLGDAGINPDGTRIAVIGWSSGGQLAMSLAWTAPQRGLVPPKAILAFYCPTDYEDEWWRKPIQPIGAEDRGEDYDVLEPIQDSPITTHTLLNAWEPLSDPRLRTDPRCRLVLHINWKAQTLPLIISGLPSRARALAEFPERDGEAWKALPQPSLEAIRECSPLAQIKSGAYGKVPTFLIHGTGDDLIPFQQTERTYRAMRERGMEVGLRLVEGGPHICDLSSDPESEGWRAVREGYEFLDGYIL